MICIVVGAGFFLHTREEMGLETRFYDTPQDAFWRLKKEELYAATSQSETRSLEKRTLARESPLSFCPSVIGFHYFLSLCVM